MLNEIVILKDNRVVVLYKYHNLGYYAYLHGNRAPNNFKKAINVKFEDIREKAIICDTCENYIDYYDKIIDNKGCELHVCKDCLHEFNHNMLDAQDEVDTMNELYHWGKI